MTHRENRKAHVPGKICACCGRSFAWRRRWARSWDEVRYCSDACRKGHGKPDFKPR